MRFLRQIFGAPLDGEALARSETPSDYAQIELLGRFETPRPAHDARDRRLWERVLPRDYAQQMALFQKQGWLAEDGGRYGVTPAAHPFVALYRERQKKARDAAVAEVRRALEERDTSSALALRRRYEDAQPLGEAEWTGPDPQMSHSALTRRILFLDHWLLDGLDPEATAWIKLYAAEQHLWGTTWRLPPEQVPEGVARALSTEEMDGAEAAFWRARGLALYVENQETWQRCKGGDHVRRLAIGGPGDEYTCSTCREVYGEQFLVDRVPELPHRECRSARGCRCEYLPVLETYEDLAEPRA